VEPDPFTASTTEALCDKYETDKSRFVKINETVQLKNATMLTGIGSLKMKSLDRTKKIRLWVLIILGCAAMAWGFAMM
jgi:hypothetical protein